MLHKHSRPHSVSEHCFSKALKFHMFFSSVQDAIALHALESPHMCSILSLRSFPNATFEFETVEATVETTLGVHSDLWCKILNGIFSGPILNQLSNNVHIASLGDLYPKTGWQEKGFCLSHIVRAYTHLQTHRRAAVWNRELLMSTSQHCSVSYLHTRKENITSSRQ